MVELLIFPSIHSFTHRSVVYIRPGVSPFADAKALKSAYHSMMRDYHPDKTDDPDAADFCVLLNDIYATLSDPDQRATYDAIAGYSLSSVDPFRDTSFDKVRWMNGTQRFL